MNYRKMKFEINLSAILKFLSMEKSKPFKDCVTLTLGEFQNIGLSPLMTHYCCIMQNLLKNFTLIESISFYLYE